MKLFSRLALIGTAIATLGIATACSSGASATTVAAPSVSPSQEAQYQQQEYQEPFTITVPSVNYQHRVKIPASKQVTVLTAHNCSEGFAIGIGNSQTISRDRACVVVICPTSYFQYSMYAYASPTTERNASERKVAFSHVTTNTLGDCYYEGQQAYRQVSPVSTLFQNQYVYPFEVVVPNASGPFVVHGTN